MARAPQQKITIRLPEKTINYMDLMIELEDFPSRSEVIRTAVRELFESRADKIETRLEKMKKMEKIVMESEQLANYVNK